MTLPREIERSLFHVYKRRDEQGFWVCEQCGARRNRRHEGRCMGRRRRNKTQDTREAYVRSNHYLRTIQRVVESENEADPAIKFRYIQNVITQWLNDRDARVD